MSLNIEQGISLMMAIALSPERPVLMLRSAPGEGKTESAKQAAERLNIGCLLCHAASTMVEDLSMPVVNVNKGTVSFALDAGLPLEGSQWPERGIFIVDEIAAASKDTWKVYAHLFQEREYKGRRVKPGWLFVATGNRAQDRAGSGPMLGHLNNRMTFIDIASDFNTWKAWYMSQDDYSPELVAFHNFKQGALLSDYKADRECNPTPRSWVKCGKMLPHVPSDCEYEFLKGTVGEEAATEYMSFIRVCRALPDPDAIIANPAKASIPEKMDVIYALCGALAHRATTKNFANILTFANRLNPEYMVLIVRDSIAHCPDIQATNAFSKWTQNEGAKVLRNA